MELDIMKIQLSKQKLIEQFINSLIKLFLITLEQKI